MKDMNYFLVEPEVMVDLGDDTVFDETDSANGTIKFLHIELESWGGDDLLTNHPIFVVTEQLKIGLEQTDFTGFTFDTMKITKGEYFDNGYDLDKPVPNFYWMKINGEPDIDDFVIKDCELYISSRVLEYLKMNFQIENMDIDRPKDEFDDFIEELLKE